MRNLGVIALRTRKWSAAQALFDQAWALARNAADAFGEANSIERLGDLAQAMEDTAAARRHFENALARYGQHHHPREADCWLSLGELALDEGDKVRAELYIQKALDLHRSAGHYLGV